MRKATFAWVMFCLVSAHVEAADPLDHWQQRYPPFPVVGLNAITYGGGLFVAVGDSGVILISSNGTDWATQVSGTTNRLLGVAFGDGKFVAVGESGRILVSSDAVNWTAHPLDRWDHFPAVTFGAGLFAMAQNGSVSTNRILTSSDGVTWTPRLTSRDFVPVNCLLYAQGVFVAGGGRIFYSTNGLEWLATDLTNNPAFNFPVQSLSYNDGLFVAHARYSGGVSTNVRTWSGIAMEFAQDKHAAAYGAGHYVWVGEGARFGYSRNGTNWSSGMIQGGSTLRGLVYGQGKFIAVGDSGRMFYSLDATNWSTILLYPSPHSLVHTGGKYVATDSSESAVLISSNLVEWQAYPSPAQLNQLVVHDSKLVGVGNAGAVAFSLNGSEWFPGASPVTNNLWAVVSSPARLIAIGEGSTVIGSADGTNWVVENSATTNRLFSIAAGDDRFVAVGLQGTVIHSADGLAWQRVEIATRPNLLDVAFGKCRFVAVSGSGGAIFVSTNGADWFRPFFSTPGNSMSFSSVAYGNGRFVACGYNSYPFPNSCVLSSSNGVDWSCHALPPYRFYGQAAFAGDTFIIGVENLVIQSDPVPAPSLQFLLSAMRDDELEIRASGLLDTCCRLDVAPQLDPLTQWQSLGYLILNSNGVARHVETSFTNGSARFFRASPIP